MLLLITYLKQRASQRRAAESSIYTLYNDEVRAGAAYGGSAVQRLMEGPLRPSLTCPLINDFS